MNKQDIAIVYLSISLLVTQFFWFKEAKRAAYLEGKIALEQEFAWHGDDGVCLADVPAHAGACKADVPKSKK